MNSFPRNDTIALHLPLQQWEFVMVLLARQPFNEVAPLIGEIQRQLQATETHRRAGHMASAFMSDGPPALVERKVAATEA